MEETDNIDLPMVRFYNEIAWLIFLCRVSRVTVPGHEKFNNTFWTPFSVCLTV